jgi:hypothetical protein
MTADEINPTGDAAPAAQAQGAAGAGPIKIEFAFMKSPLCRVIHVDGAWGGITGHGDINMALFSEHREPPPSSKYNINRQTGEMTEELGANTGTLVREIEVQVVMNLDVAIALRAWLDERIETVGKTRDRIEERRKATQVDE